MSEQRETRNSLFRSSISINSIRRSATQFSKSLTRTSVIASQIEKTTRQRNIFNQRSISKDNEYFRKRRENIRRKQREDELESSSISGVTKKEGNIVSRSTRGFLGRILDFFGIILIGWFVTKLPDILKAIRKIIGFINKAVRFLTNFLDGVKEFLTNIGDGIKAAIDSIPKFDFLNFKKESEETLKETEDRSQKLLDEFKLGFLNFGRDINTSIADEPGVVEGGEVVIPNEDQVGGEMIEGETTGGEDDQNENVNNNSTEVSAIRPDDNKDEKLRLQEDNDQASALANLDKLNQQSDRLKNVYGGQTNKVTEKVKNVMSGFGPGGEGGGGSVAQSVGGGVGSGSGGNDSNYEASGFDDDDTSTDDDTSDGTPQPGDFYMTVGGQGNKQKFYHVLQPNGKIKSLGKNKRPDGGSKFSRSMIVAAGNSIKAQNIKGVSSDDRIEILSVKVHSEGEDDNIFIDSKGKMNYNLEEIFKKDRPTIILKDLGFQNPNVKMPNFSGSNSINFDFIPKKDDSLSKYHTLILDGI